MNISYKWLADYLPAVKEMTPQEVADALTSIGLETGSVERVDSIKGGLEGLVVGHVLTCTEHPNSDHLHCTTVDVGTEEPLKIVCGAPNIAQGQYVIVATIGTTLYSGEDSFVIKKSKLRGEESYGMICSEVEIGIGSDSSGILALSDAPTPGTSAAKYFNIECDYVLEVDITPNRVDATSHFGVARDLAAYLNQRGKSVQAQRPEEAKLSSNSTVAPIDIAVEVSEEACPRYQGVVVEGLTNGESPEWLQQRLTAIGLRPLNLLVDISNYVLHEMGQPLHFFDADRIAGGRIRVAQLPKDTPFTTLDGVERKLQGTELMICDDQYKPLCMAGVFGGLDSGVTETTTRIFIECANFNSTLIRKAARAHALNTDSSFRFERGLDPEATNFALRRVLSLITELIPQAVVGSGVDVYRKAPEKPECTLRRSKLNEVAGAELADETVLKILQDLDINPIKTTEDGWLLSLPVYRTDVRREIDVIEEILRIYGYNEIPLKGYIHANLSTRSENDLDYHSELILSEQLVGAGYNEILSNSLTAERYYTELTTYPASELVSLVNPLSRELGVLRQTLLFGGLEAISRNFHNKQSVCAFFEWGNCYRKEAQEGLEKNELSVYKEKAMLGLWLSGTRAENNWLTPAQKMTVYHLKSDVENLFRRMHIVPDTLHLTISSNDLFTDCLEYRIGDASGACIAWLGRVKPEITHSFEIEDPVFYAEIDRTLLMQWGRKSPLQAKEINKYPVVKRDLALLLDEAIPFIEIEKIAYKAERKLLQRVELFDVYTGKNLPEGKKSYAVSFYLQDETATLTDKQIEKSMLRIRQMLEKELGASLR
ncbi:phenylalanyl-tRNA synthetase subunit beta [Porphyromonas gingivicanis]|uniref:Phenylalanine--tRNA ligase beta subunit n=1 Tax=Porphyromonas gingivicanis TaxID=266762 RepID=A0A0A2G783_9PORP|nr:phenylalanine--tRNA ligase subunit beta [Porphyromonas gingivicanis]KGN99116.1 phenylalanyl-tRNA synthetase subunit beta [Porphyromonas gingivicanis]